MNHNTLRLKKLGIDSRNEHLVFMRKNCPVCMSEGFEALSRIRVSKDDKTLVASLIIMEDMKELTHEQLGLSDGAIAMLGAAEGDTIILSHPGPLDSMSDVRSKIYGKKLPLSAFSAIVRDIVERNLSNVQLSAFLTACAGDRLDLEEIISLTKAMVNAGAQLRWDKERVFDKHCIGGLPGNRTTPIVVAIVASAGLTIPKTSSRAITSPAGTADTMESITAVNLSVEQMKEVVNEENGCLVWGGSVQLSPADDILIRVERALDLDSEGQLIASVLSKKVATGSTDILIDIPVGPTAKIRTEESARLLAEKMTKVGEALGLHVEVMITDGTQPVGRGIGPALEARDVLSVLRNDADAPQDLRQRGIALAGRLLEMGGKAVAGGGKALAEEILASGDAFRKFQRICYAQGEWKEPGTAAYIHPVQAEKSGLVTEIDNRKLARIAKLAGAPDVPTAGVYLYTPVGAKVVRQEVLFEIHAGSPGELHYATTYLKEHAGIINIDTQ